MQRRPMAAFDNKTQTSDVVRNTDDSRRSAMREDWMTATLASSKALWMLEMARSPDPCTVTRQGVTA